MSDPHRPDPRGDLAACRALLRGGSRSFDAASRLLPARVHEPASALYAFCRVADDAIDAPATKGGGGLAALPGLRARVSAIYATTPPPGPDYAPDRALAWVVREYGLPRPLLDALLEGFEWDLAGRRYDTLAALHDYAARVAGTVGAMMAVIMGATGSEAVARACDLGVAMQLSNIARDVGEDARAGRIYLPGAWMADAGIDVNAWLRDPVHSPALAGVVAQLLSAAEALYARAMPGIGLLPLDCRPGVGAAARLYREIGRTVARNGFDSVTQRAVVPRRVKLAVVARGAVRAVWPVVAPPRPALAATQGLVSAVQAVPRCGDGPGGAAGRVVWLSKLFSRIDNSALHRTRSRA